MTDTSKLISKINDKGLKMSFIAQKLGISYQGLKNKIENKREFKVTEMFTLCDILNISEYNDVTSIFFAHNVE